MGKSLILLGLNRPYSKSTEKKKEKNGINQKRRARKISKKIFPFSLISTASNNNNKNCVYFLTIFFVHGKKKKIIIKRKRKRRKRKRKKKNWLQFSKNFHISQTLFLVSEFISVTRLEQVKKDESFQKLEEKRFFFTFAVFSLRGGIFVVKKVFHSFFFVLKIFAVKKVFFFLCVLRKRKEVFFSLFLFGKN